MRTKQLLVLLIFLSACNKDNGKLPKVMTSKVVNIAQSTASCRGKIISKGETDITAMGVCWGTYPNPTILGSKSKEAIVAGSFESSITNLVSNTTYYVRAYATNSAGTSYGQVISFTTKPGISAGTVKDIDNNVYNTVSIGNQVWIEENLKTTTFNDGIAIPNVTENTDWSYYRAPAYCWYDNDEATYKSNYGALYNWHAVNTKKLCPLGWHVPSDSEWQTLVDYLGGYQKAGCKLKEAGTIHWASPNNCATNESGFSALPAGYRDDGARFDVIGYYAYFWSSSINYNSSVNDAFRWRRMMYNLGGVVDRFFDWEGLGFSVRCVKDDSTTEQLNIK